MLRPVIISKWENLDFFFFFFFFFWYLGGEPDRSQNLMGSKMDQDPSSDFYRKM